MVIYILHVYYMYSISILHIYPYVYDVAFIRQCFNSAVSLMSENSCPLFISINLSMYIHVLACVETCAYTSIHTHRIQKCTLKNKSLTVGWPMFFSLSISGTDLSLSILKYIIQYHVGTLGMLCLQMKYLRYQIVVYEIIQPVTL